MSARATPPDTIERANELLDQGLTVREVAGDLNISERTIYRHCDAPRAHPYRRYDTCRCAGCFAVLLRVSPDGLCVFCQVERGAREPV